MLNLIGFYRYLIFVTQNQVLRKLVKHHNLVNVNSKELQYLQRTPFEVFFVCFHTKLWQLMQLLWLQPLTNTAAIRRSQLPLNVNSLLEYRIQAKTFYILQGVFIYENWRCVIRIALATLVAQRYAMHSCPKKTSEAIFEWIATTARKMLIRRNYYTYKEHPSGCFFYT